MRDLVLTLKAKISFLGAPVDSDEKARQLFVISQQRHDQPLLPKYLRDTVQTAAFLKYNLLTYGNITFCSSLCLYLQL